MILVLRNIIKKTFLSFTFDRIPLISLGCKLILVLYRGYEPGGGGGTCGQPGYVFRDFCLKRGIEFIIFCLNHGIGLSILVSNRISFLGR